MSLQSLEKTIADLPEFVKALKDAGKCTLLASYMEKRDLLNKGISIIEDSILGGDSK